LDLCSYELRHSCKTITQTEILLAFYHPKPVYKFHILLVPKKSVASLEKFDSKDSMFLTDLYTTVQSLVDEFQLATYHLIVNGGEYQDFPQLHFHLVSDIVGVGLPAHERAREPRPTG